MAATQIVLDQPKPDVIFPAGKPRIAYDPIVMQKVMQRIEVEICPPESRPSTLLLGTINRPDFRVLEAIPVKLELEGVEVVASWDEVSEFGMGKSTSQACEDLGYTIAELYISLEADQSHLGPDLLRVFDVLKQHIARR